MKYLFFSFIFITVSCNQKSKFPKAENALDAGREFIGALLKEDFKKAAFYMILDNENSKYLSQFELKCRQQSEKDNKQYQLAVINIYEVADISASETIINYSNSYDKIRHKIKVLKVNGDWKVDLKSTINSQ